MRILLVEDEAPLRETLSARLKREGFPVDAASDGDAIVPASELAALKSRVTSAEAELERLRGLVDRLYAELDIRR